MRRESPIPVPAARLERRHSPPSIQIFFLGPGVVGSVILTSLTSRPSRVLATVAICTRLPAVELSHSSKRSMSSRSWNDVQSICSVDEEDIVY